MKIEDIKVGDYVIIGTRFLGTDLWGRKCKVLEVSPPHPDLVDNPHNVYPHGCLKLRLPEGTQWGVPEVFIGPEDVAPPLGA